MKPSRTLSLALAAVLASACAAPAAAPEPTLAPAAPSAPAAPQAAAPREGLTFIAQAGWIEESPANEMRKAQFRLPHAAGEASLVVFHFASQGGTLEANLARWAGQFEQPDGGDSMERMTRSERQVADLDVLLVDLSGTYVAETFPGSGERVREEGWRMLTAVIETPQGPYYAKLVGPAETVAAHEQRFDAFLAALR
jgi:hypothetical protein